MTINMVIEYEHDEEYAAENDDENVSLCTPSKLSVFAQTTHSLGKNSESDSNLIINS